MAYVIAKCDRDNGKKLHFYGGCVDGLNEKIVFHWGGLEKAQFYKDRDRAYLIANMLPDNETVYVIDIDGGDCGAVHGSS